MEYEKVQSKFTDICTSKCNIELKNLKEVISTSSKTQYREWEDYGFDINHQFSITYGKDIEIRDSLLHLAVKFKSQKLVKYLLDNKANVNVLNQNGHSPITCALFCAFSQDMLNLLMENNADIYLVEKDKETPLTRCIKHINNHSEQSDEKHFIYGKKILQILIEHVVIKSYMNKKSHLLLQPSFPEYLNAYWENCTFEIERMKISRIAGSTVSFFDFIKVSDDDRLMLIYNQKIDKTFKQGSYKIKFCIYSDLIEYKYKKALEKKNEIYVNVSNNELTTNLNNINTQIALKNSEKNIYR